MQCNDVMCTSQRSLKLMLGSHATHVSQASCVKRRDRVCHPRPKFMSGASLIDVQGTAASLELTVKTHALNFEHKMRLFSKQKAILFLKRFSNNNGRPIIKFYPTV